VTPLVLADTQLWWFVARSSGVVAWALSALAVLWGMALSSRALGRRPPAPWLLDVHRFLGGLTVAFVAVHVVALVLDPFVAFGPVDVLVPFASSWEPVAVAWGVVALYLLVAVELTSLLRSRLPVRLWRSVHLSSYALYVLATVHLLTAGSERRNPALLWWVVASVGGIAFFSIYRWIGPGRAASVRAGRASRDGSAAPNVPGTASSRARPRRAAGPGAATAADHDSLTA
jgi:predicted ferric reductase